MVKHCFCYKKRNSSDIRAMKRNFPSKPKAKHFFSKSDHSYCENSIYKTDKIKQFIYIVTRTKSMRAKLSFHLGQILLLHNDPSLSLNKQ